MLDTIEIFLTRWLQFFDPYLKSIVMTVDLKTILAVIKLISTKLRKI